MDEIQGYLIAYLAKAIEHLQGAPEEGSGTTGTGLHMYLDKVAVIVEGECIGYLYNEDPDWVYRPVKP